MYNEVDCLNCEDYEYDDPHLFNNCIHYERCLAQQKKEKEEKKRGRLQQEKRI